MNDRANDFYASGNGDCVCGNRDYDCESESYDYGSESYDYGNGSYDYGNGIYDYGNYVCANGNYDYGSCAFDTWNDHDVCGNESGACANDFYASENIYLTFHAEYSITLSKACPYFSHSSCHVFLSHGTNTEKPNSQEKTESTFESNTASQSAADHATS